MKGLDQILHIGMHLVEEDLLLLVFYDFQVDVEHLLIHFEHVQQMLLHQQLFDLKDEVRILNLQYVY